MISNIAILGAQAGDEAKGAWTNRLSKDYDWVIRFNGGNNAGHTIYRNGQKHVHHLMPSFNWEYNHTKAFLSSNMVIDLIALNSEINQLFKIDPELPKRVFVDPDAFLVLDKHIEEDKLKNGNLGTTNKGIGPAYTDKINRTGIRIRDLLLSNDRSLNVDGWSREAFKALLEKGVQFKGILELYNHFNQDRLLFEGAQGVLLDVNHGTYPYVSSSQSGVAGIYSSGFHFAPPKVVYGVTKCYTTKVGTGPFPTEIFGESANKIREIGKEYGATTGRPRRIGWLDLPALKYGALRGGITNWIMTKFDVLDGLAEVPVCTSYDKEVTCSEDFFNTKPQYVNFAGWTNSKDINLIQPFINNIQELTKINISYISCGVNEEDTFKL